EFPANSWHGEEPYGYLSVPTWPSTSTGGHAYAPYRYLSVPTVGGGSGVLAAHGDDLAGHVRREVARQEHDHIGDFPGLGGAAERLAGLELGQELLGGHLGEERMHRERRRDRVHAHAARRGLDRCAPRERHDAGLCRGVVRLSLLRTPAHDRRVVHDRSAP